MDLDLKDDPLLQAGGFRIGPVEMWEKYKKPRFVFRMKAPVRGYKKSKKVSGFYYVRVPHIVRARQK